MCRRRSAHCSQFYIFGADFSVMPWFGRRLGVANDTLSRMKPCAFLTLDERGDFVIDDEHAVAPLAALGWEVSTVSWRQTAVPWSHFEAVVIRSTWDYWNDVPAFLAALERIDRQTRLANPLDLVRWNLAKTYMRDLQGKGVGVVPTAWLDGMDPAAISAYAAQLGSHDLVVKPVVGANGQDAFRISPGDDPRRLREIAARFSGRACMVQPFRTNVLAEGEYSLFFFSGDYSHAILKVPAAGEFRSQEEHGAEVLSIVPETRLLECGRRALAAVAPTPLYARVDFVRDAAGDFEVMELELIEPSLYLRTDPEAPARFARAVDRWFAGD
jgi:glutathione synthase/RimK-type ligase-like ATP-grasp enzyme